jgi:predicted aspartyl protease
MTLGRRCLAALLAAILPLGALAMPVSTKCKLTPLGSLPLSYHGAELALVLNGEINGTPALLLLDTGADLSLLTRFGTDKRGMALTPTQRFLEGVGGRTRVYVAGVNSFKIGPIRSSGHGDMPVLDTPGSRSTFDGIVSAAFLFQRDLEISLAEKTVRFFLSDGCERTYLAYWDPDAVVVPLEFEGEGGRPMVEVQLNGVKLRALIDTGATRTVVTERAARAAGEKLEGLGLKPGGTAVGVGRRAVSTVQVTFKRFALGGEVIERPELLVLQTDERRDYDMILGRDYLRAHRMLFAVQQRKLYLSYLGGQPFQSGWDLAWLRKEAEAGNGYAQHALAAAGILPPAEASAWLRKAADQSNPLALRRLGRQLAGSGRLEGAIAAYEKLVEGDRFDLAAQLELYTLRLRAGQETRARADLDAAMKLLNGSDWPLPIAQYYLGRSSFDQLMREARDDEDLAARRQCQLLHHVAELREAGAGQDAPAAQLDALRAQCRL